MRFQEAYGEAEYPNRIVVQEEFEEGSSVVAIERAVLDDILRQTPLNPDEALELLAQRAMKRLPCPNGLDGERVITRHNLTVVWP